MRKKELYEIVGSGELAKDFKGEKLDKEILHETLGDTLGTLGLGGNYLDFVKAEISDLDVDDEYTVRDSTVFDCRIITTVKRVQ